MKSRGTASRREFLKIAGGSAFLMLGGGNVLLSGCGAEDRPRGNYRVFSKGTLGDLRLKNRIVKAATATAATTEDCTFLDGGVDMYRNWSQGGSGLIITGHMTVAPIPKGTFVFGHALTCIYDDESVGRISRIADAVHDADSDCKIIAQINHIGMTSATDPVAASSVRWPVPFIKEDPRPLSTGEVQEVVSLFVAAAGRAKRAGFDGVELHGSHGFLLNTFLSPYTNQRTDQYGGLIRNRVRIIGEIVDGIRTSVDPGFPVLIKASCTDAIPDAGTNIENFPELADELAQAGIDALEISGNDTTRTDLDEAGKQSYYAPYAEQLDVDIPVILTGGNKNIDLMESICQRGEADYFGLGRPLIREPNLPNRWLDKVGNAECDCISCNKCAEYLFSGKNLVTCQLV